MAEVNFYNSIDKEEINLKSKAQKQNLDCEEKEATVLEETKHDSLKDDLKKSTTEQGIGSIVANHYNKIAEVGLHERKKSRIVNLRNFNNWIKSYLIAKYLDLIRENSADEHKIIALDLGAGKGGDLLKWQKGRIRHLICADIAEECVSQCKERYETSRNQSFTAEFITVDCSKTRLKLRMKVPGTKFDIVSCQFALHYSFESLPQAETMIRNAAESLRKGGYFVATFPNANKITSLIESSVDGKTFENEVLKIEFPDDRPSKPKLFGDQYHFYLEGVVNCPEFLIHIPTLIRICQKYGLEIVYNKLFEEIYEEGVKDRDARSLLFRMQALESYESFDDTLSSSNKDEYSHAQKLIDEKVMKYVKTMSRSEWETACVYMAVAFKKVT